MITKEEIDTIEEMQQIVLDYIEKAGETTLDALHFPFKVNGWNSEQFCKLFIEPIMNKIIIYGDDFKVRLMK